MQNKFWVGLAMGAAVGATGGAAVAALLRPGFAAGPASMLRVERSVRIGLPAPEVFAACARLQRMPQLIRWVVSIASSEEDVSFWIADVEGQRYTWDVEIVQVIPNEVIGWKSYRGPKHSGTVNFFPLGPETLVQVDMNCEPRSTLAHLVGTENHWSLGDAIEAALHDLKDSLENRRRPFANVPRPTPQVSEQRSTGTYGPRSAPSQVDRSSRNDEGGPEQPDLYKID